VALDCRSVKLRMGAVVVCWVAAAGATVLALCGPGVAGASTPSGASVTFSGAVSGHLTTPKSDCPGIMAQSGEIDFYHSLKGHSGNEWSLFYTAPHNGTWKPRGLAGSSSFSTEVNGSIENSWYTKSGSFKVKGATGSVDVTLQPEPGSKSHGLVHVKGTWNCS
jgi:hypothetical protein